MQLKNTPIIMYKNGKVDSVQGSILSKVCIIWENALNKSCSALNSVKKKVSRCTCVSPSGTELGGFKDCHFLNIIMYKNGKVDSV